MKEHERAVRAATSYVYNKELMPKVEVRLAKALSVVESYLLRAGQEAVRLGRYQVELRRRDARGPGPARWLGAAGIGDRSAAAGIRWL